MRISNNNANLYCIGDELMSPDEIRSHHLNSLLRSYLNNQNEQALYNKALSIGVTVNTAKDYVRSVIIQAGKTKRI